MLNRNKLAAAIAALLALGAGPAVAAPAAAVTKGNDSGDGSLRAALASGATVIVVDDAVGAIGIDSTLYYDGTDPVRIVGSGQTVEGEGFTLLEVTLGADLTITDLAFDGGDGYDIFNQGVGKGIFVNVPDTASGLVTLKLTNVTVLGVADHGIHLSDCGGTCDGPGSDASLRVTLTNVIVDDAGYGKFDADGVRVDERGAGDIVFEAVDSTFVNVGADGVELDEGDTGGVRVDVRNSLFADNGGYCLPEDPDDPTLDPSCVEDGELDLDDGFDIDEAGDGSISGMVGNSWALTNEDEGLDFDEEGEGGIDFDVVSTWAIGNFDENIKMSEEDGGDVLARLRSVVANDSIDNDGIQIEEEDEGNLVVTVNGSEADGNDNDGIDVSQETVGADFGTIKVRGSNIADGVDADGVDEI